MSRKNENGGVVVFFVLIFPVLLAFFWGTIEISKLVFIRVKAQETLDRANFAGASSLTESLNQIALLNRKANQLFLDRKKDFLRQGSRADESAAKKQLKETERQQNILFEKMQAIAHSAYPNAYKIVDEIIREEFPQNNWHPIYQAPIILKEGPRESLPFFKIKGNPFDPTGHKNIPKEGFDLRVAFDQTGVSKIALGLSLNVAPLKPILPMFDVATHFETTALSKPFGGDILRYALQPQEQFLFQTTKLPYADRK